MCLQWDLKHKCRFLRGFCVLSLCRCGVTQHADVELPAVLLHQVRSTIGRELICPNNGHLTYDCWSFPIFVHGAVGNLFKVINREKNVRLRETPTLTGSQETTPTGIMWWLSCLPAKTLQHSDLHIV